MAYSNPFPISTYAGPAYFCDRIAETKQLQKALGNGRHLVLHSPRRMGKTALIKHLMHELPESHGGIFVDLFKTRDLAGFNQVLLEALAGFFKQKNRNWLEIINDFLQSLQVSLTFDPLSGNPKITVQKSSAERQQAGLQELFKLLHQQDQIIYLALDEFQAIQHYPEKNVDAIIREQLQQSDRLRLLFSGSQKHLLLALFTDPARPLFRITDSLALKKIPASEYQPFIRQQFHTYRREIADEVLQDLYAWCAGHTYYVQQAANRLFALGEKQVDLRAWQAVKEGIIKEQDAQMSVLQLMLKSSPNQWRLLRALALEGPVAEISTHGFQKRYDMPSSAATVGAVKALLDKELVYVSGLDNKGKAIYELYDPFMANWFRER